MTISIDTSNDIVEIVTIVVSIISMLFSLSVVVILLMHYNSLVSGKLLIHNVLIIAICDTLVSFSYALGYHTQSQYHICAMQGFISINAERASWFWTDCLILNIYGIMVCEKYIIKSKTRLHIIVWTIVILLAFIPYATGVHYGTTSISPVRCGFGPIGSNAANNWGKSQNLLCIFSLIIIFVIAIRICIYIYYPSKHNQNEISRPHKVKFLKTLLLYPAAMFICWVPSQFYNLVSGESSPTQALIYDCFHILSPLYGLLLSLIFYTRTDKARTEWINILIRLKFIKESNEIELRESSNTISSDISLGDSVENTLVLRILE